MFIAVSLTAAIVGAANSRSAMSVIGEIGLDIFMQGADGVSAEQTDKKIEKRRKVNADYTVPEVYKVLYSAKTADYDGFPVCYFGEETAKKIIYFHGGSFMWQPLILHYSFCEKLQKKTGMQVIMPLYPKAPDNDCITVLKWLDNFYSSIEGTTFFIGDSSGGGLMISFAQYRYDGGKSLPEKIVAISPVMDIALTNPEIADYAKSDPMLNRDDLARKMATHLGDTAADSPYVSPIYCDYSVLPEVSVITGTHDILFPDIKLWDENLKNKGIVHGYYVFENQNHVFPLYPMPERTVCVNLINAILETNQREKS